MSLSALEGTRLLIVSGKGGVGKSTVCAAMALIMARRGKQVLTVEIDSKERISQLFGAPEVGHDGRQIYDNIYAMNMRPARVMDEFVASQAPLKTLANQIVESSIYQYFVAAAPGIKELVTIGKIMVLEEERASRRSRDPRWDFIIVDAPATGHGIALLRVPYMVLDTLRVGPVAKQARKIIDLLTDEERTRFMLVTLAEDMPTNEAIEMYHTIHDELGIPMENLVINGVYPKVLGAKEQEVLHALEARLAAANGDPTELALMQAMIDCAETAIARRELNEKYMRKLKHDIPHPAVEVPFVFAGSLDFDLVETVATALEARLEALG